MAIVDVEYERYPCPHCKGFIQLRQQFYHYGGGESHTIQHIDEQGNETEIELPKRIIKSPPKPRPTSLKDIKRAVKKAPPKRAKHELVQLKNPITKHWILIDKTVGIIIKHSRTSKPYKNIKIVTKPSNIDSVATSKEKKN